MKKGSWVECPIEDATHVELANGARHDLDVAKELYLAKFDAYIPSEAFSMLGIKPVKWVEEPIIEMTLKWAWQDSKGRLQMIFDLPYGLDESFFESIKGDKFRLIEVLDESPQS